MTPSILWGVQHVASAQFKPAESDCWSSIILHARAATGLFFWGGLWASYLQIICFIVNLVEVRPSFCLLLAREGFILKRPRSSESQNHIWGAAKITATPPDSFWCIHEYGQNEKWLRRQRKGWCTNGFLTEFWRRPSTLHWICMCSVIRGPGSDCCIPAESKCLF